MKHILHSRTGSVWRHRDLRLAGPAQALTFLGGEVVVVALVLEAFSLGWGTVGTAAVLACAALPLAAGTVLAGPVVDRVSSRRLGVAAATWQALVCFSTAALHGLGASPVLLLAALLLLQAGQAVAGPTWAALLPSLVPRAELPAAVGAVQGLAMLLGMAGPVVAGASVGLGGVSTALVAAGSCFAAVAVLASCVRTRRDVGALHGGRAPRAGDGLAYLRTEPVLSVLVTGFVAFVLAVELVGVVTVFLVRDRLGADELTYGVLGAVLATGLVAGNLLAGRVPSDRLLRAVVLGAAGMSLALVAGGLAPGVLALGVAFLALGLANGIVNTAAQATLAVRIPHEQRGRVLGATSGVLRTASVVGVVGGGLVGTVLGPRELFVAAGVAGLLVSGWLGWRLRPDAVAERVQDLACIPTRTVPSPSAAASATSPA